jgi:riboflavin biosynthesis pyrimidine reductase
MTLHRVDKVGIGLVATTIRARNVTQSAFSVPSPNRKRVPTSLFDTREFALRGSAILAGSLPLRGAKPLPAWSVRKGDVAEGIAALKQEDGPELQVHGSGNLIQTLLRHNLVDLYRLLIFPVVIGSGKRLFSEGTIPSGLKLADSTVSTTGAVTGTYEPAGEIVTGSFAQD